MANAYRDFIDFMADLARSSVTAKRIRSQGHAERANDGDVALTRPEARRKATLLAMSAEQRAVVAELLEQERVGAIHDVIANLDAFDVRLDERSLSELADEEPKFDFLDRMEGHPWRD